MKGHIIRAILYQDMTVKWKDVEEGIPARLNVHQKARQFVEVELGDFLLAEDEAILAAFEKVKDGDTNHINSTVMEQVVGDKKVYRLQIPPQVHNEAGEWEIQFSVASNYSCDDSGKMSYDFVTDSGKLTFVEFSSLSDDGLTIPSGEDLKVLLVKKIEEYNDAHYIRITGMSGTFTEEEAELIKTDFENVCLILKNASETDKRTILLRPLLSRPWPTGIKFYFASLNQGDKFDVEEGPLRYTDAYKVEVTDVNWHLKVYSHSFDDLEDGRLKVYGAPKEDNDVVRLKELNDLGNKKRDVIETDSINPVLYAANVQGQTAIRTVINTGSTGVSAQNAFMSSVPLRDGFGQMSSYTLDDSHSQAKDYNLINRKYFLEREAILKSLIQKLTDDLNTFFADADVSQNAVDTLLELQKYVKDDTDFASQILLDIHALEAGLNEEKPKTELLQKQMFDVMNSLKQDTYDSETQSLFIRPSAVTLYSEETKDLTFLCPVLYDITSQGLKI